MIKLNFENVRDWHDLVRDIFEHAGFNKPGQYGSSFCRDWYPVPGQKKQAESIAFVSYSNQYFTRTLERCFHELLAPTDYYARPQVGRDTHSFVFVHAESTTEHFRRLLLEVRAEYGVKAYILGADELEHFLLKEPLLIARHFSDYGRTALGEDLIARAIETAAALKNLAPEKASFLFDKMFTEELSPVEAWISFDELYSPRAKVTEGHWLQLHRYCSTLLKRDNLQLKKCIEWTLMSILKETTFVDLAAQVKELFIEDFDEETFEENIEIHHSTPVMVKIDSGVSPMHIEIDTSTTYRDSGAEWPTDEEDRIDTLNMVLGDQGLQVQIIHASERGQHILGRLSLQSGPNNNESKLNFTNLISIRNLVSDIFACNNFTRDFQPFDGLCFDGRTVAAPGQEASFKTYALILDGSSPDKVVAQMEHVINDRYDNNHPPLDNRFNNILFIHVGSKDDKQQQLLRDFKWTHGIDAYLWDIGDLDRLAGGSPFIASRNFLDYGGSAGSGALARSSQTSSVLKGLEPVKAADMYSRMFAQNSSPLEAWLVFDQIFRPRDHVTQEQLSQLPRYCAALLSFNDPQTEKSLITSLLSLISNSKLADLFPPVLNHQISSWSEGWHIFSFELEAAIIKQVSPVLELVTTAAARYPSRRGTEKAYIDVEISIENGLASLTSASNPRLRH